MKTNTKRPIKGFTALLLAAVLVLAAASVYLQTGWEAHPVTLRTGSGDVSALRGFTVEGAVYQDSTAQVFTLHDGYLDTSFYLSDSPDMGITENAIGTNYYYTVTPSVHETVNDSAVQSGVNYAGNPIYSSTAQDFRKMVSIDLPDGDFARIALCDFQTEQPYTVTAQSYNTPSIVDPKGSDIQNAHGDYVMEDFMAFSGLPGVDLDYHFDYIPFRIGDDWGICLSDSSDGRVAGLYRIRGAVQLEALNTLEPDGYLGDKEIVCASTEIGSLEPFYCPNGASSVYHGMTMADGKVLMLYLNNRVELCADLISPEGKCLDHKVFDGYKATSGDNNTILSVNPSNRLNLSDAVFILSRYNTATFDTTTDAALALRVEGDKFSVAQIQPISGSTDLESNSAILNDAGDALMMLDSVKIVNSSVRGMYAHYSGLRLTVYELGNPYPEYTTDIMTGQERDWGVITSAASYFRPSVHSVHIKNVSANGGTAK